MSTESMPGHVPMTEEELQAAQQRMESMRANHELNKEAAQKLMADRLAAGGAVPTPESTLDRGIPRAGDSGLPTAEQFEAETEGRAALDIILGLREIEGAESVRWKITRLSDPTGRKPTGYLTEWSTDLLSTARIQEDFGAGTYRVVGTRMNGQYAAMRTVKIAEDLKRPPEQTTVVAQESSSNSMSEIMVMLGQQAEQRRQDELDRERREETRDERRRKERNELLTVFAPVIAAVVPALIAPRGPDLGTLLQAMKPPPQPTLLETMAALKALAPAPVTGPDPIDRAMKLVDIFTDKMTPNAEGSGWVDVFKEFVRAVGPTVGPVIGQLAQAASVRAAQAARTVPASSVVPAMPVRPPSLTDGMGTGARGSVPAAPTGFAGIPSPPGEVVEGEFTEAVPQGPQEGEDMGMWQLMKLLPWLRGQLTDLVKKAKKDADADLYAEVVIDSIPDEVDPQILVDFLQREDWLAMMTEFNAEVGKHQKWFTELREAILDLAEKLKTEAQLAPSQSTSAATPTPVTKVPADPNAVDKPLGPPGLT
jgi:hypothetical protein